MKFLYIQRFSPNFSAMAWFKKKNNNNCWQRLQGCRVKQISPAHAKGGNCDGKGADGNAKDANIMIILEPKKGVSVKKNVGKEEEKNGLIFAHTERFGAFFCFYFTQRCDSGRILKFSSGRVCYDWLTSLVFNNILESNISREKPTLLQCYFDF